jgi:hypothetical protein
MKKLLDFKNLGSVLLMLSVLMSSCKQEANFQPISSESETKTLKMSGINEVKGDFTVEDGVLHFSNPKAVVDFLELLGTYDISERRNFGVNIGFTSMLNSFCDVLLKSSTFEEKEQRFAFLKQNEDIVNYDDKGMISFKIANANLASIIDRKGNVYIGKVVYKFNDFGEAIALDGDKSKLENVDGDTKSDINVKVFTTKQNLNTRIVCGTSQFANQFLSDRAGKTEAIATYSIFYMGTNPSTGEPFYDIYDKSYTYGVPYKWKCNIFGGNCSWENYSTNNTLSVNHQLVSWNGVIQYGDNLSYSNSWNTIDYNGSFGYAVSIPASQVTQYLPRFASMNPNRYQMTNTGVDIQIFCN